MTVLVYRLNGIISRSLQSASLVVEVEVDELPRDLTQFARQHGGHFAEVAYNSPTLEELATA